MVALAQIAIAMLPTVTTGIEELVGFISKVRTSAQQTGEWPQAAEDAYQASLIATSDDPAYKPDVS